MKCRLFKESLQGSLWYLASSISIKRALYLSTWYSVTLLYLCVARIDLSHIILLNMFHFFLFTTAKHV